MSNNSIQGVWKVMHSTDPVTTNGKTHLFPAGYFIYVQSGEVIVTGYPNNGWWGVSVKGDSDEVYGKTGPGFTSFFEIDLVNKAPESLIMGSVVPAEGGSVSSNFSGSFLAQSIPPSAAPDPKSLSQNAKLAF